MTVLHAHVQADIIDNPQDIADLGSTKARFIVKLETASGTVYLTANQAAMVHGLIRGTWERVYGEKLPVS